MYSDLSDLSDISDLSSVPSSPRPSPPPPERYPTPSSSQDSGNASHPPARKRRRNPLPKERTTQYLNLSDISLRDQHDQLNLLLKTLRHQKDIVVIAGAGISTSAGSKFALYRVPPSQPAHLDLVPDFRSTDGLFKSLQKKHNLKASGKLLFDAAVYQDDGLTASFHEMVRSLSEEAAKTDPTEFHHMLARLGQESRLKRLYTQNIDGIETSMPPLTTEIPLNVKGRWPVTIQLHGSLEKMVCQKCRYLCDFNPQLFRQPDAPACTECSVKNDFRQMTGQRSHGVGRMRPRIVLYNEHNPDEEAITSVMNADIRSRPRVLIVAGTSLKIPGVRRLVKSLCTVIRSRKDGVTMWINNEPPNGKEFENCFDLIVQGSCDEVAHLANLKRWDDHTPYTSSPEPVIPAKRHLHEECTSSDTEREKSEHGAVAVVVASTPSKRPRTETGLFTPSSSHDEKPLQLSVKAPKGKGELANPASRGRSLTVMLKSSKTTAPSKPGRKKDASTIASKKRKPDPTKTTKITNYSRVTKSSTAAGTWDKTIKQEKSESGQPMHDLPAGAARNNGPVVLFPNLPKKDTTHTSIPNGMAHLIR